MDLQTAIVVDESEFLEFVHEKLDTRARRTNHFSEHLLGDLWNHCLRVDLACHSVPAVEEYEQGVSQWN